jgi:hypothetical protein
MAAPEPLHPADVGCRMARRDSPMTTPGEHRIEGKLAAILNVAGLQPAERQ